MSKHRDQRLFSADFFDHFTRKVHSSELWRIYDGVDTNSLRLFLSDINGSVLDFGCGDGRNIPLIVQTSQQFCVGIDISRVSIQKAKVNICGINADLVVCDGTNLPFNNNMFEAAMIVDILHHSVTITQTLLEVLRVLKPRSQIFVKDLTYTPLISLGKKIIKIIPKQIQRLFLGLTHNLNDYNQEPPTFDLTLAYLIETIQKLGFHITRISKSSFFVTMIYTGLQIVPFHFLTRSKPLANAMFRMDEWIGNRLLSRYPRIVRISAKIKN